MGVIPRDERRKRRGLIAVAASGTNADLEDIALSFKCHLSTVYGSMREFNVTLPDKGRGITQFEILAAILDREDGETDVQIAYQLGLSKQRISAVHADAREWGLIPSNDEQPT